MTAHDPLCPWMHTSRLDVPVGYRYQCECDLIARVRAAVAEEVAQAIENSLGYKPHWEHSAVWVDGYDEALRDAAAVARRIGGTP